MIICISGFVVGNLPHNFDGFPPLRHSPAPSEKSESSAVINLASSMEKMQIRTPSIEHIRSHSSSLEQIQNRTPSLEEIESRSSSLEHIQAAYSPSPIPICCRNPKDSSCRLTSKQHRPKKVSFRLDELPQRRPQTTV